MMAGPRAAARKALPASVVLGARTARRVVTTRPDPWLTEGLGTASAHGVRMRPLERGDADSWGTAMRANYQRMSPWWSLNQDEMARTTDRMAFLSHLGTWERRRRSSTGICLAFVGPGGDLVGEVQVWHVRRGGRTCELGLWLAPDQPRGITRGAGGCLGQMIDRMFDVLGLGRVDAPVATENPMPRAFLEIGGFRLDAHIPQWRELHGELVDYDLFGLTPQRWQEKRPVAWRVLGPWAGDED